MTKTEIQSFAGLVGLRVDLADLPEMRNNTAFRRLEQGLFDRLNQLYDELAKGGLSLAQTENIRGQILATRYFLGLPELIRAEAESFANDPVKYEQEDLAEMDDFVQRRYPETTGE